MLCPYNKKSNQIELVAFLFYSASYDLKTYIGEGIVRSRG